jgi:Ca2+-binding RTX toxin-like protein
MERARDLIAVVVCLLLIVPATGGATENAAGATRCLGEEATIVGSPRPDTIEGTPGRDVIVGKGGRDEIRGRGGDDLICGTDGDDVLRGGGGLDGLDGGRGDDKLMPGRAPWVNVPVIGGPGDDHFKGRAGVVNVFSYREAPRGIHMDLGRGIVTGWGRDTLENFEEGDGSRYDDVMIGSEAFNGLFGGEGDDRLESGGGPADFMAGEAGDDTLVGDGVTDIVGYEFAPSAVMVDLAEGSATGDGSDTLQGIEIVFGSFEGDDVLLGDDGPNAFHGFGGDDVIDGRGGVDLYTFSQAPEPVVADLETGEATGEGNDTLSNIEDLIGSLFDDELRGTDGPNLLLGLDGDDSLAGRGGDDLLQGDGDGYIFPDPENDTLDGGDGTDICFAGENNIDCESTTFMRKRAAAERAARSLTAWDLRIRSVHRYI